MALICIIIGLILERAIDNLHALRNFNWYEIYSGWMMDNLPGLGKQGASSIIILLLPVMLLTLLVQNLLADTFFDLFSLIFGLAIFAYTIGPGNLDKEIDCFLQSREDGDEERAEKCASAIMGKEASKAPDQQIIDVMHAVLYEANDRIFSVIFWFVILGPFGALLVRLTSYTMRTNSNKTLRSAAKKLQAILAWAPARLVAFGYALTGNYEAASASATEKCSPDDLTACNYNTLVTAGLGALKDCSPGEETACIHSTRALVLRTLVLWLAAIAVLTLLGWTA